ncbi:MAG: rubrerythrin family protein [Legionella sp. 40-6]|nr:ferritin-like domain-containing protein [Legionella sp.]OJY25577.1 MAG: rubrerythrin family protein [Legionella sp. 40-6]
MVTLVGTQSNFASALYQLCELDYDAVEAYEAAINRLDNPVYKEKLEEFKEDHQRHIQQITQLLKKHQLEPPSGPGVKQLLTQGKVVFAELLGDKAILHAMLSNEIDTNTAYERLTNYADEWIDALDVLNQGYEDEKKHKKWLETTIAEMSNV